MTELLTHHARDAIQLAANHRREVKQVVLQRGFHGPLRGRTTRKTHKKTSAGRLAKRCLHSILVQMH